MQETFSHLEVCKLSIRLLSEALMVVEQVGVKLKSLPDFPVDRLQGLIAMPLEKASELFSQTMTNLSKEPLYGSILQSIKKGKPSEIDYFNGEIVRLGGKIGVAAPLNEKLVRMVHKVERGGGFSRPEEILSEVGG
jgi:2-dehydropantoate 2-reductase